MNESLKKLVSAFPPNTLVKVGYHKGLTYTLQGEVKDMEEWRVFVLVTDAESLKSGKYNKDGNAWNGNDLNKLVNMVLLDVGTK